MMREEVKTSVFMAGYFSLCFLIGYVLLSTLNKPTLVVLDGGLTAEAVGEK